MVGEFEGSEPNLPEPGTEGLAPAAKPEVIQKRPGNLRSEAPDIQGKLVDDLSARGLMPSSVIKLLGSLASDRLDKIPDYIDYFDHSTKGRGYWAGLLYELIRNTQRPVAGELRNQKQQKADRLAAEIRSEECYPHPGGAQSGI